MFSLYIEGFLALFFAFYVDLVFFIIDPLKININIFLMITSASIFINLAIFLMVYAFKNSQRCQRIF